MPFFDGLQGGKPGSRTGLATRRGPALKAVPGKVSFVPVPGRQQSLTYMPTDAAAYLFPSSAAPEARLSPERSLSEIDSAAWMNYTPR